MATKPRNEVPPVKVIDSPEFPMMIVEQRYSESLKPDEMCVVPGQVSLRMGMPVPPPGLS